VTNISAGYGKLCAVYSKKYLKCYDYFFKPVIMVPELKINTQFVNLSPRYVCAISTDSKVKCWDFY